MPRNPIALAIVAAGFSCAAFAQSGSPVQHGPRAPDPADPGAQAPALKYESAFRGYRGMRDGKPAPWREVNDEVEKLGGHIGHLRSLEKTDASTPAPAATPAAQPRPTAPARPPAAHKH